MGSLIYCTVAALVAVVVYLIVIRRSSRRGTPPGPKGLPFIGNALQIPTDHQWLKFDEWHRTYGDVVHFSVMGQPAVVLGSFEAATELLDGRGAIYSDRPRAIMAGELVGWARGLGYAQGPPNPRFRELRRLFHAFLGPRALADADGALARAHARNTARLLGAVLAEPAKFAEHARAGAAALLLRTAYGYDAGRGDPRGLVRVAEDAMVGFARASEPGAFWVDSVPMLRYVPAWVPGAGFQREAARMRADLERLYDAPFKYVVEQVRAGTALPSLTGKFLEETSGAPNAEEEELIKAAAASLYSGGAETTPSALVSFVLAMTLYPDVQARAHAEVDALLGGPDALRRLPTLDDRPQLPYVAALVSELWRWQPSVPLGLPHAAARDDVYRGHRIARGTVVWPNIWTMLHDPVRFPNPDAFRPERFLGADGAALAEDAARAFGFGRRACPGQRLAEDAVFLAVAALLCVLRIAPGKGGPPVVAYDGFISHARPFECDIAPRGDGAVRVVQRALDAAAEEEDEM